MEMSSQISNEAMVDELRRSIIPWVPAPVKSESVSKELFKDTHLFEVPAVLPEREEEEPVGLIRKEKDN